MKSMVVADGTAISKVDSHGFSGCLKISTFLVFVAIIWLHLSYKCRVAEVERGC